MHIRLAIVDGQPLARYGLRELAGQHPEIEVVADCGSRAEAWPLLQAVRPDVVVTDAALPDGDGLKLAWQLREGRSELGVVLLAACAGDDIMFRALQCGASAFVAKTAPLEDLLTAIRHAAVAPSSFTAPDLAAALGRRRAAQDRFSLSGREEEVLHRLRDGMSVPAIAQAMFISLSTAKTYVARLYEKLGAKNRAQALMIAVRDGLIRCDQAAPPGAGRIAVPHQYRPAVPWHPAREQVA
jgi:DNA-binding NarL/FixJ family response regulator